MDQLHFLFQSGNLGFVHGPTPSRPVAAPTLGPQSRCVDGTPADLLHQGIISGHALPISRRDHLRETGWHYHQFEQFRLEMKRGAETPAAIAPEADRQNDIAHSPLDDRRHCGPAAHCRGCGCSIPHSFCRCTKQEQHCSIPFLALGSQSVRSTQGISRDQPEAINAGCP
jgi:hypothetical protein